MFALKGSLVSSMLPGKRIQTTDLPKPDFGAILPAMRFDLHVHSACSFDGRMKPEELVEVARQRNLDGICITDHQTMAASRLLSEGRQPNGLIVLFGMEYATEAGDFLVFGPFEGLRRDLSADQLFDAVEKAGGAAVAAHPFRAARPVDSFFLEHGPCRIFEGLNGRNTDGENRLAATWCRTNGRASVAGSDAHTREEVGACATRFTVPIRTRDDLVRALNDGAFLIDFPAADPIFTPSFRNVSLR
jgi:predicted metal-dependent phosphoesterase TrpH